MKDITPHPCCEQPPDRSAILWRYMDLSKLISILDSKSLIFPNLTMLRDAHEGALTRQIVEDIYETLPLDANKESIRNLNRSLRHAAYVSCWHTNEDESEAMWQLYCGADQGIALQTTYQKLYESIVDDTTQMGVVKYIDYEKETFPANNFLYPIMHKRKSFKHEQEVRIVCIEPRRSNEDRALELISKPWDIEKSIDHIFVNPYAPAWYKDVVTSVIGKYSPQLAEKVRWSAMKAGPFY